MRFLSPIQRRTNVAQQTIVTTSLLHSLRRFFAISVPLAFFVSAIPASAETPITLLRGETREMLQKEAVLKAGDKKDQALTALCDLYVVLRQDQRYSDSEMLQQDAAKIRRRLISSAKQSSARLKRNDVPRPAGLAKKVDLAIKSAIAEAEKTEELAGSSNDSDGSAKTLSPETKTNRAGNAGAAGFDTGWELVELMQRVVSPDFWEPNGGPGVIYYFAMRRVLVVRATSDVHEQVRDLLKSLPR